MNKYCKVNTLPTEILREILLSACEYGLHWRDLRNIIQTCKPWYTILSHDPAAYSTINIGDGGYSLRLLRTFAERSLLLPLSIVCRGTHLSMSNLEGRFLCRHISRIKNLEVSALRLADTEWLCNLPAPQLERCKLVHFGYEGKDDEEYAPEFRALIISHVFGRDAPKLHTLDLRNARLAWRPGNYSNLRQLKITFHPKLLATFPVDSGCVSIIFLESPRLEQVEFAIGGSEDMWTLGDVEVPSPSLSQPKCVMLYLHTLRLHLTVSYLISVLRKIEITPVIKTVDLYGGGSRGVDQGQCLEVLDTDVLLSPLFDNLHRLSFCKRSSKGRGRSRMAGSGSLETGIHSLLIDIPLERPHLLANKIASERRMARLRRIVLPDRSTTTLAKLLAVSPVVDEVSFIVCRISHTACDLQALSSDPRSLSDLAKISHWAFVLSGEFTYPHATLYSLDMTSLHNFFKRLPSRPRTLSVDVSIMPTVGEGLDAARDLVMKFAQLDVAITRRIKSTVFANTVDGDSHSHEEYAHDGYWTCPSTWMDLWSRGEIPPVARYPRY